MVDKSKSRFIVFGSRATGAKSAGMVRTAKVLKILEPITLPMIKLYCFLRPALMAAASSGRLVPTATIDKPITKSDTPQDIAISTAPQTNTLALINKNIKPPNVK